MELTEQRLKKILQEQRLEYQRHLDVVAEEVQEQLVAIRDMVASNTESLGILRLA